MSRLAVPLKFAVDIAAQDQRFRARRTGQSPIEYANAIHGYRRPVTGKTWAMRFAALALLAGAIYLGAM
jgi:hypothetical protein